jgi:pimeloyl-ACP methyl ester carboxylesterase
LNRWVEALLGVREATATGRIGEIWFAPRYSLADFVSYFGGYAASDEQFDLGAMDLRTSGTSFALPIIIIQGGKDLDTPVELARSYFDSVTAPRKVFVTLPNGWHTAIVYDRTSFLAALSEHVLPLAGSATR